MNINTTATVKRNFAILTRSTEIILQTIISNEIQDDIHQKLLITPGALLRIIDQTNNNKNVIIQLLDYYHDQKKNPILENLYKCPTTCIKIIQDNLWPYLIAIHDPEERLQSALNGERCKEILQLKPNDIVTVSGEPFRKDFSYLCIIRYIGLVPEYGPGYYFGLELLDLDHGWSPQTDDIPFVTYYMQCDPKLVLILSGNWVTKDTNEKSKKFSASELFCGTIQKARNALGLSSSSSTKSNNSPLSSPRKQQIIDNENNNLDINRTNNFSNVESDQQQQQQQHLHQKEKYSSNAFDENAVDGICVMEKKVLTKHFSSTSSSSSSSINFNKKDKSTNTSFVQKQQQQQLQQRQDLNQSSSSASYEHEAPNSITDKDRKDRSSNQSENLISLDSNEDYTKYVENYERTLERQHESGSVGGGGSSSNSSIIITTTDINKPNIPVSILKQPKNSSGSNSSKKKSLSIGGIVKPNTIMSLEDRDIVVIDKADIKESTMNESEVIVLDNPRSQKEVDLADLLGSNWPTSAGDAALVLNTEVNKNLGSGHISSSSNSSVSSSFNATIRNERNKSANPISHLVNTKVEKRNKENLRMQNENQLSGNGGGQDGKVTFEKKLKNIDRGGEPIYDNANIVSSQIIALTPSDDDIIVPSPLSEIPGTNLGVGSMVEVSTDVCEDLYGVIRWIGCPHGSKNVMVGVELEDDPGDKPLTLTDGSNNGIRLFRCPNGRAIFIHPNQCSKDRRFNDIELPQALYKKSIDTKMFGQVECPPVPGAIAPLKIFNLDELEIICGKFKGIQGHHNSCYLDATLFAMFTFTSVFDSLLFRPPEPEDISHYEEVQQVLREEIVNPLRKNLFVRADKVMKLRQLLERLSSVSGLTSEEKDPEEFLNSLLAQILRADPFLKLSSGQDAFFYQLFVEKDERLNFPSVQQLFEQSFLASDIKLKEVPSCLIIQMPRFGKNFKMYPRILPSQVLDVTDIIEDSPRQCSVCGKLAEFECKECFGILQCGVGLESTAFCKKCLETVHSHAKRANHTPKEILVPQDFKIMAEHLTVPRLFMELFAVVCIETSHYVAFVKAGSGLDAPWCFFDSMADRKGEQNGYNIPEMVSVPDLPQWLSEEGARVINEAASNDKMLPEHAKRLLCDAYMCMYQSTDVMMYR